MKTDKPSPALIDFRNKIRRRKKLKEAANKRVPLTREGQIAWLRNIEKAFRSLYPDGVDETKP